MMSKLYLYGIVSAQSPLTLHSEGLAGGLCVIATKETGVIAGTTPVPDFQGVSRELAVRWLMRHQQVLEEALAQTTVLPVKFGTVAPNAEAIFSMLEQTGGMLASRLAEFGNRLQVEVVAQWRLDQVYAAIGAESEIAGLRGAAETMGGAQADMRLRKAVRSALGRRRASVAAELCAELETVAADITANPPHDDRIAVKMAVLLDRMDIASLDGVLNRLSVELAGEYEFQRARPSAPSSFATVEVTFPSRERLQWARGALDLGERANLNEVNAAYHRLARVCADGPLADLGELTDAYRTVMAYAPDGDDGWVFDVNTMAGKIIVNVVREDMYGTGAARAREPARELREAVA